MNIQPDGILYVLAMSILIFSMVYQVIVAIGHQSSIGIKGDTFQVDERLLSKKTTYFTALIFTLFSLNSVRVFDLKDGSFVTVFVVSLSLAIMFITIKNNLRDAT